MNKQSCSCNEQPQKNNDDRSDLFKLITKELLEYTLDLEKPNIFKGITMINGTVSRPRVSLNLKREFTKEGKDKTTFILQFLGSNGRESLIRPFEGEGLLHRGNFKSKMRGFSLEYRIIDQTLSFNTTNNDDINGLFSLQKASEPLPTPDANANTIDCGVGKYGFCGYCNCGECTVNNSPGYFTTTCGGGKNCQTSGCRCGDK